MSSLFISLLILLSTWTLLAKGYMIGTGIADITGPVAELMFMGYAKVGQTGQGLLQRIWARAFIIADQDQRVVFVNTDTQSMGDIVKQRVVKQLQNNHGNLYTLQNVVLSSTHSHSGAGGFLEYTLYELSVLGWSEETTQPMVDGIVQAIQRAHISLGEGSVHLTAGELLNTNINRSPASYRMNPAAERAQYQYDVDKMMTLLAFRRGDTPLGLISWFAVHGTSVNNTNRLVNGDNKGYAAYAVEKAMNPDRLPGKGPFVAAFANANEGDVSPNTLGAFCTGTRIPCDGTQSDTCPRNSTCNARGPGWEISDYESNRIIGQQQADKALDLLQQASQLALTGVIDSRQKYWDITKVSLKKKKGRLCAPAMGYAFAAGTTDGPGLGGFYQNTLHGTPLWDFIKDLVQKPSPEQVACQHPKPILLDTGEISIASDWQPRVLDVQLIRIGQVFIAAVPSEMTTMSGRRLRHAIQTTLSRHGLDHVSVILSAPANGYASYCTTFEEYQLQRYEGASTPYGPYTLDAYIQVFEELAEALVTNRTVEHDAQLPDSPKYPFSLTPRLGYDLPSLFHSFGDVLNNVKPMYSRRMPQTVSATFVAGNPRNNVMHGKTFLTVEQQDVSGGWKVIRTDDDYDTRFRWTYTNRLFGHSKATIEWDIGTQVPAGKYRLGYFGHHRRPVSRQVQPHHGYSNTFVVSN